MNSFMPIIESMMKQLGAGGTPLGQIGGEATSFHRMRRNRKNGAIRGLVQETHLTPAHFISPLFIEDGSRIKTEIKSMPDVHRFSLDTVNEEIDGLLEAGIRCVNLFCYIPEEKKDPQGSQAIMKGNLLQQAVSHIKKHYPEIIVMADIALDPFTDHGHDGILDAAGNVLNDPTCDILAEMSLRAAEAGVDFVSPSDMMDGRVQKIRRTLDKHRFHDVGIMSYAVKIASSFYAPFRDALNSAPKTGDKKSYQLPCTNIREALLECALDEKEGADLLLIKPALTNLDIIARLRPLTNLPIGAYHISGEYSMLKAAAERGWIDFDRAIIECLTSIKRAGADFIVTYAAKRAAELLQKGVV